MSRDFLVFLSCLAPLIRLQHMAVMALYKFVLIDCLID